MPAWWAHNLKYKDLNSYRHNYEWEKCKITVFMARVRIYGKTKEEAILPVLYIGVKPKNRCDDNGRVCNDCWEYKTWDMFSRMKTGYNHRSPNCLECRNKKKREYRAKTNRAKDREYKQRTRKLAIWDRVSFMEVVYKDWLPREEVWIVKDKKPMQAYTIQSELTELYGRLDTVEWNPNYKKFYKLK